jgi:hypothetical protein
MVRFPNIFGLLVGALLLAVPTSAHSQTLDDALIRPDGTVAPSIARAYQRSQALGNAGTAVAVVAWPAFWIGFAFTLTDTRFSVASGQAIRGAGAAGALLGVPMMLHAASQGANLLRLARPGFSTKLVTAGWVFDSVSVGFGALTVASLAGNWANGQPSQWLVRPTTFGIIGVVAGIAALYCARKQLDKNTSLVRTLDYEIIRLQARTRPLQLRFLPTLTVNEVGLAAYGEL